MHSFRFSSPSILYYVILIKEKTPSVFDQSFAPRRPRASSTAVCTVLASTLRRSDTRSRDIIFHFESDIVGLKAARIIFHVSVILLVLSRTRTLASFRHPLFRRRRFLRVGNFLLLSFIFSFRFRERSIEKIILTAGRGASISATVNTPTRRPFSTRFIAASWRDRRRAARTLCLIFRPCTNGQTNYLLRVHDM